MKLSDVHIGFTMVVFSGPMLITEKEPESTFSELEVTLEADEEKRSWSPETGEWTLISDESS